jgi:hypothetical protein
VLAVRFAFAGHPLVTAILAACAAAVFVRSATKRHG